MAQDEQTFLTIHGLEEDNKFVRAEVLSQKLQALISGLRAADVLANGKESHAYIVEDMHIGSAVLKIREKPRGKKRHLRSSIQAYEASVRAIYQGDASVGLLPPKLVRSVETLSVGSSVKFAHAELGEGHNLVRIDDFLLRQARRAEAAVDDVMAESHPEYFTGIAQTSLDGVLQLLDSRGTVLRAKLTTTAGRKEIDCVVNKNRVPDVGHYFDARVLVEGTAHYERASAIPRRLDVVAIKHVKADADIKRWRSAFAPAHADDGPL